MTRPHDMGGRYGDGPVVPEPEPTEFHAAWHKRALAITLAAGALGTWNIDGSRHARERLAPADYGRFSYYEKWMAALADLLVEKGLISRSELAGQSIEQAPLAASTLRAEAVAAVLAKGAPVTRPSAIAPRFGPGDRVKTRRIAANALVDGGHTRLPQYVAGAVGQVVRYHGTHVLPDSAAHGLGDAAEPLFAVAFPAAALWSHPEHPDDAVVVDLWQSYLEPA